MTRDDLEQIARMAELSRVRIELDADGFLLTKKHSDGRFVRQRLGFVTVFNAKIPTSVFRTVIRYMDELLGE